MKEPVEMAASAMDVTVSGPVVVGACIGLAIFYVAILYSPTLFRLPPPDSLHVFMIRRFVCAIVSTVVSVVASSALLGVRSFKDLPSALRIYGIRSDHMLQAVGFPILLTYLPYAGSLVSKFLSMAYEWRETSRFEEHSMSSHRGLLNRIYVFSTNVLALRVYVVAPITEELVFRACMVPLLCCGGFKRYTVIFLCPTFFSLAHLNNFLELHYLKGYSYLRASKVVGVQLGYTMMFGWYAAFLFMRTGNVLSPIVAHIVCNSMGLPAFSSSVSKVVTGVAFLAGFLGFSSLLFPATDPILYNDDVTDGCWSSHSYCGCERILRFQGCERHGSSIPNRSALG